MKNKKVFLYRVSDDLRYDGMNHLIIPCDERRRCAGCPSCIHTQCVKCEVGLCVKCFAKFHVRS